jgi:hypothetical protein
LHFVVPALGLEEKIILPPFLAFEAGLFTLR